MPKIPHSIKVPPIYKIAGKILKETKEESIGVKASLYKYNNEHINIKVIYALVTKALEVEDVLNELIDTSKILVNEKQANPWLIRILITDLLFGRCTLKGNSKPVLTVLSYEDVLRKELKKAEESGTFRLDSKPNQGKKPRYVRVNTLKLSLEEALSHFRYEGWTLVSSAEITSYEAFLKRISSLAEEEFMRDYHIPDLLIFPKGTTFYAHELYLNGSIILQDKSSSLSTWLLNPSPNSTVLDLCAAPGMKTSHLAALMENQGTLHAVEKEEKRYNTLCDQVEKMGLTCVKTHHEDALNVNSESCPGVEYILVDPSCSGSGITDRPKEEVCDSERLKKLAGIQFKLLRHALTKFPDVKRVVYSTCSVYKEENEMVVTGALGFANAQGHSFEIANDILKGKWLNYGGENFKWGDRCIYARPEIDFTNGFFIAVINRVDVTSKNDNKRKGHTSEDDDDNGSTIIKKKRKKQMMEEEEDTELIADDSESNSRKEDVDQSSIIKKKKKKKKKKKQKKELEHN